MAIRCSKTVNVHGENIEYDCYGVINRVEGDKSLLHINIDFRRIEKREVIITSLMFNFVPSVNEDSSNFLKQGYEYLKTLDEFADAIDC